jgi:molybdate transport system ATP-binding protein
MLTVIHFDQVSFTTNNTILFEGFTWEIKKGQNWAITGQFGSGKTKLLQALQGNFSVSTGLVWNHFGQNIEYGISEIKNHAKFVFFHDQEIDYRSFYYQQRYNSTETEGTLTVNEFLFNDNDLSSIATKRIIDELGIENLITSEFIKLSNGETRKVLLAKAMIRKPKLLVLDNPYAGLDLAARRIVNTMIDNLINLGTQVIMVSDNAELPHKITHILHLNHFMIDSVRTKNEGSKLPVHPIVPVLPAMPSFIPENAPFEIAVKLTDVTIKYEKNILNEVNWTILKNEKWALTGHNGAGKSMLISLIYADNPQAYANDIILFDHRRGQGESIWDIKEKIGFVSPELHAYYDNKQTCREAVLSSVKNPYKKITISKEHVGMLGFLFHYYCIDHLVDITMDKLSTGQQRLILFISVLMKNPALLLLDEPFQGFDHQMIEKSKLILDLYCQNRTLIFVSHKKEQIPSCITCFAELDMGKLRIIKNE